MKTNPTGNCLHLHVGLQKTGTTTLQRALFARHPEIYYLGKNFRDDLLRHTRSKDVLDLLTPIIWRVNKPLDAEKTRRILIDRVLPDIGPGQAVVASWEGLINAGRETFPETLRRAQTVFGACRIIVTLRTPLKWIPSLYLQNLKGNFMHKRKIKWMETSSHITIEEWFDKRAAQDDSFLRYAGNVRKAVELLGRENVKVCVFEQLAEDPASYHRDLCGFIGVDPDMGEALTTEQHLHKRITAGQLDLLQRINDSAWREAVIRDNGRAYRKRIFAAAGNDGVPARIALPERQRQIVADAFRDDFRWIADTLQVPLKRYGYPL